MVTDPRVTGLERDFNSRMTTETKKQVGKKLDTGKAPLLRGLLAYFPNALAAVAKVSEYGATKYNLSYEDKNWVRVEGGLGRYGDALARHTTRHAAGESHDPESHLLHVAHAAWNALAVLELVLSNNPLTEEVTMGDVLGPTRNAALKNMSFGLDY